MCPPACADALPAANIAAPLQPAPQRENAVPLKLHTVICSTRPARIGPVVDLPVFDEPEHPRMQRYVHEHTKRWAASVSAADAFVFVTPEYNFGPPPALLNALNYLYLEWNYKPAGFVSYGGASGGMRAVQAEKLTLTTLKVVPLTEAVAIPMAWNAVAEGKLSLPEGQAKAATAMLDELARWAEALKPLRG
jgi:NAD(P)H-dependent FMN reductase